MTGAKRKKRLPGLAVALGLALAHGAEGRVTVRAKDRGDGVYEIRARAEAGKTKGKGEAASIHLRDGRGEFWSGAVEEIERYGRAGVRGLRVRWRSRPGEALYGLGERFDGLDVGGKRVEMWIRDVPGQDGGAATYYATPVLYSGAGYAIFAADNPEGEFDLDSGGDGWHRYERAGSELKFWVASGGNLRELVEKRTKTIGGLRGAPDWAWGPWISRNSYESQAEAEEVLAEMARRRIPVAAMVQEAWKGPVETGEYNEFSRQRWPGAGRFLERCEERGIRNVLWQVPIVHPESPEYGAAAALGYFVKDAAGAPRLRKRWMEGFANVDFTDPEAAEFWKDRMRPLLAHGAIGGFKADDGEDVEPEDWFADGRRGWQLHNEYAALYARALTELLDEEGAEGFLWSRSGSLGIEKTPGLWAGDQHATWEQMATLVPAGLSAGLSGAPFWGHDIGGYVGDPGEELYVRWAQFGALSPMMQYHGMGAREPWAFGERAAGIYKKLARLRMNLRPTLAALGKEAERKGWPIMRPMAMEFPGEGRFAREQTQYMLGADMLVAPVLEAKPGRKIAFPEGEWQHLLHPVAVRGPAEIEVAVADDSVPAFVREGAVLGVELEEGAELGEWSEGMPARKLEYARERTLLRDLRAPFRGDALEQTAKVGFRAARGVGGRVEVQVRRRGDGRWVEVPATIAGGRHEADLGSVGAGHAAGDRQPYRIWLRGKDGKRGRALYWGEVEWEMPATIEFRAEGGRYLEMGRKTATTVLRNASDRPLPVRATVQTDVGAAAMPSEYATVLAPRSETAVEWVLDFGAPEGLGDRRAVFRLASKDREAGAVEATYCRPWRWIVAGPFPAPPGEGRRIPFPPEWEGGADARFETPEGLVRWRALDAGHVVRNDGIDLAEAFGAREHAVGYAETRIWSEREQDVELRMGPDDALAAWVNGELVFDAETRGPAVPDSVAVPARFHAGTNRILAKVAQETGEWKLHFRATGPGGGQAGGLRDGFGDVGEYDPGRPEEGKVERMELPAVWKIAGPYPAGILEARIRSVGLDALNGLDWKEAAAPRRRDGAIDLRRELGAREGVEAYAMLDVLAAEATPVEIRCGSDDGLTVWANGLELFDAKVGRAFAPGENRVRAEFRPGRNRVVLRVRQETGEWKFRAEVWDVGRRPARPLAR